MMVYSNMDKAEILDRILDATSPTDKLTDGTYLFKIGDIEIAARATNRTTDEEGQYLYSQFFILEVILPS